MKKKNAPSFPEVLAAVAVAALLISASVTFVLFDRGAYVRQMDGFGLQATTGMDEKDILDNYNALIDYNSVFFRGPLEFPTLPMSEAGQKHFEDVKAIFVFFQIIIMVSAALTALCCILLLRKRRFRFLALGGILALAIPAAVACVMAAVGWDRFFVLFHEVFFYNDLWIFDAQTDPVILILPDAYFLNCLVRMVAGIILPSVVLIACFVKKWVSR